jgi:hypothetical protein
MHQAQLALKLVIAGAVFCYRYTCGLIDDNYVVILIYYFDLCL